MLWHLVSVGKRASCFTSHAPALMVSIRRGCSNSSPQRCGQIKMFEDRVFWPLAKKEFSTLKNGLAQQRQLTNDNKLIHDKYEEAVSTLNTLQSNAETVRISIAMNNKQMPLDDMIRCLERSGLNLNEVEKLSFIHISGSKGKGSTCALTESILRAHGVKTGFYSSPHLVSVTERIRINGVPISKQKFTDVFWRVYNRLQATKQHDNDMPAYFKILTVLCFHVFVEEQVDVAILEVGIGGEFDCTNIIRNTKTVGITSLGIEHTHLLGNTLTEIAWQKAGIIKPDSNVFTAVTQPEGLAVIKERAAEKNATFHIVPELAKYLYDDKAKGVLENMNAVAQLNASLAVQLSYDWLRNRKNGYNENYALNSTRLPVKVLNALNDCIWPGRSQLVKYMNFNVHLEGAHTPESMKICSDWFHKIAKNSCWPKVLIFNATGERDSRKLLQELRHNNKFDLACFVPNIVEDNNSNCVDNFSARYCDSEQLRRVKIHAENWRMLCAEAVEPDKCELFSSVLNAFRFLVKHYGMEKELDVLVTGSLYLVGTTIKALNKFHQIGDKT